MSDKTQTASNGVGLGGLLFLLFLALKLLHKIDWSWWWVTAPLWIPFAIIIVVLLLVGIGFGVAWIIERRSRL